MIALAYIGIILAAIIVIFAIELLIACLYPNVSVQKQPFKKRARPQKAGTVKSSSRKDISFEVDGTSISAWLYLPKNLSSPVPCIVMGHGLGGKENGHGFICRPFSGSGYGCPGI